MRLRDLFGLLLVVVPLAFPGCGSGSETTETKRPPALAQSQASAKAVSACSLLTHEEAAAILGESVEKPTDSAVGGTVTNCNWMTPSFRMIGILVRLASGPEEAEAVRKEGRLQSKSIAGVDPEDVSGLGESAYWAGGRINQLNVFKGNYWLIITANNGNDGDNLALAKAVAEKALARLG